MAEALGLASSIIAVADLAGKTISLTIKLKALWEEVKDMPVALIEKAEHLQHLEELLCLAEQDAAEDSTPTVVRDAMNRARDAKNDVQNTIDACIEELASRRRYRRRIAAARIVIQKGNLRTVEEKLDRALDLYKFAHVVAYGRYNFLIYKKLTESPSAMAIPSADQSPYTDTGDSASNARNQIGTIKAAKTTNNAIFEGSSVLGRLCFGVYDQKYSFSMRTPDWLGARVYSAMIQRSVSGWQSTLSVYPVVHDFGDEVHGMLYGNDINGLQRYLCENNLTPLVHDKHGFNLLHLAMLFESMEMIKWLLGCGLHPGSFSEWNGGLYDPSNPLNHAPVDFYIARTQPKFQSRQVDIFRLCQDFMPDTVESHHAIWFSLARERSFENFTAIQMVLEPRYLSSNKHHRYPSAFFGVLYSDWDWYEVKKVLPELETLTTELTATFRGISRFPGISAMAAAGMGRELARLHGRESIAPANCSFYRVLSDIASLDLEDIIFLHHDSPLHWSGLTPLSYFLKELLSELDWQPPDVLDHILQSSIIHWATILYSSDNDLLHYGRKLKTIYQDLGCYVSRQTIKDTPLEYMSKRLPYTCSLLGITYGSLPAQWRVWWSSNDNDYAANFWNLVEDSEPSNSVFKVPGGWENDFDDGNDDDDDEDKQNFSFIWSEYRKIRPPV